MKAYEFPSVIATRNEVDKEFRFFREMMNSRVARESADTQKPQKHRVKGCEFPSVIATRNEVTEQFRFFREMMDLRSAR